MDNFLQADIFFFVTTIVAVLVGILFVVVLVYAIKILRDARYIIRRAREESDLIFRDVEELRKFLKKEGSKAARVTQFIRGITSLFAKHKRSRKKKRT